jgi:hypothetical protein
MGARYTINLTDQEVLQQILMELKSQPGLDYGVGDTAAPRGKAVKRTTRG